MDVVKNIMKTNVTDVAIPGARVWLESMDSTFLTFLALGCAFFCVTVILASLQLYFVIKYVSNERMRTDLYYLVWMYPVTSLCSVVGMFIPRSATFLYAVALVYFMFCLFIMVTLLFNIFGSRKKMSEFLLENLNLRRIEWLVFQTPIIRTCLELSSVVVFMELGNRESVWFMYSQLIGVVSMCVAFYGCYVMIPLGREKHAPYKFDFLFRTIDIAQCIYTIQKFCFDFSAALGIITSDRILPAAAKAQWWASFMLTWEMMLLSALTSYYMRPSKSLIFDKYPVANSTSRHFDANGSNETIESISNRPEEAPKTDRQGLPTSRSTRDRVEHFDDI